MRALAYSQKYRFVITGHDNAYQADDGSQVKLDSNPLKVFYMNALAHEFKPILLEGFTGSCFSISLIEPKNFVIALSSQGSEIHIWDYLTCYKVLNFSVPSTGISPEIACKIFTLVLPSNNDCLLVGKSDGSILVSTLVLSQENSSLTWTPQQRIKPKLSDKVIEGIEMITYIDYVPKLDAVLIGNASSSVMIISNFFVDCLGFSSQDDLKKIPKNAEIVDEIQDSTGILDPFSSKEIQYEEERKRIWKALNEESKNN